MEATFEWVVWHLCFIEHFDHSAFSEWDDWFGRGKDVGLEEIGLILPSLFFLEMLGVARISGTMPVNQADDKACAKGSFPFCLENCLVFAHSLCSHHPAGLHGGSRTSTNWPGL